MITELSLFTGYSGISLGVKLANINTRTIAYVEWEKYAQEIIKARIKDKLLSDAPIFSDISSFRGEQFRGMVDLVTAGFPCQPHSFAGARRSSEDSRNKWPDTLRVIREVAPRYILLENVSGLLSSSVDERTPAYGGVVVGQLTEIGYDCFWEVVGADDAEAPHRRKRWFCFGVLADSNGTGAGGQTRDNYTIGPLSREGSEPRLDQRGDSLVNPDKRSSIQRELTARNGDAIRTDRNMADSKGIGHRGGLGSERGDGERIVQQEEQGRSEVGSEAARRNRDLADSTSERLQGHNEQPTQSTGTFNGYNQGELDDSQHDGCARSQEPRGTGSRAHPQTGEIQPQQSTGSGVGATGSNELADSNGIRYELEKTNRDLAGRERSSLSNIYVGYPRGIPSWPPGPSQSDEWGRILTERPDLAPALTKKAESQFRGMVDGRTHRVDELKALGNGVVPAVVALFLRRLLG